MLRLPKIRPMFAWYDLWVGLYWDRKKRRLHFLPVPTLGIVIDFSPKRSTNRWAIPNEYRRERDFPVRKDFECKRGDMLVMGPDGKIRKTKGRTPLARIKRIE